MTTPAGNDSSQRRSSSLRNISPLFGKPAPLFALPNPLTGEAVSLESYANQDVLLIFLRGTWCPFCVQQLQVLKENFATLQKANIAVLAVVCQSQMTVKMFLKGSPLPFPLLCDGNRAVAKSYDTHYWLSHEGFNLSNPALFILDKQHTVTFAHIGQSMSDLPVGAILEKFIAFLGSSGK